MYQIMLVEDEMLVGSPWHRTPGGTNSALRRPMSLKMAVRRLNSLKSVLPDMVITDICMPFVDGLELARNIYEKFPTRSSSVLTFSEFSYAQRRPSGTMSRLSAAQARQPRRSLISCWRTCLRSFRAGTTGRLYSRAVLADEVLKDHFFQGLYSPGAGAAGGDACRRC